MDIGKIRTGGGYPPGDARGEGMPGRPGRGADAGREMLSVGTSRAHPLEEAPVTAEVEADLRRDDDLGLLFAAAYRYQPPELRKEP